MRKIAIGSGLTILAAAAPAQAFEVPGVAAPAGVTEAGAVRLSEPDPSEAQPVVVKDKPAGVIGYDVKLSNDVVAKPETTSTQLKYEQSRTTRSRKNTRRGGNRKP